MSISGTATFQNFIGTASYMGLVRIISAFGSAAVAGNTIGIRVFLFALLPSWGVSNAAVTLVGQNLGAGTSRPRRSVRLEDLRSTTRSAWCRSARSFSCSRRSSSARSPATPRSRRTRSTACGSSRSGFLFYGYGMVLTAAFNGAGDTRTPTLINLVSLWLLGDSPGLGAGQPARLRTDGRVHRAQRRLLDDVLSERVDLPRGSMENGADASENGHEACASEEIRVLAGRRPFAVSSSCG